MRKKSPNCSGCGQLNDRLPQGYCKKCHAKYMLENRPKHRDLPDEARKKANARSYAHVYVKRGKIEKKPCMICGSNNKLEMHHEDHNKPTEVIWLCRIHHIEVTKGIRNFSGKNGL